MKKITHLQKNLKSSYLFIVAILSLALFTQAAESSEYVYSPNLSPELEQLIENATSNSEKLDLDLFVMSYCPYGIDAELAILPYVKAHQDKINLNIYYIADEMTDGSFESLHGEKEVEENLRQLIIKRLYPDKYMDYILLRGKDIYNEDLSIVSEELGIDIERVNSLLSKEESLDLLRNNILISRMKEVNASPTLYVKGEDYKGGVVNYKALLNGANDASCKLGDSACVAVKPREFAWFSHGEIVPEGTIGATRVIKGTIRVCQYVNGYLDWLDIGSPCPVVIMSTECKLGDTKCKITRPVQSAYLEENGECVKYRVRTVYECQKIWVGNHIRRPKQDWVNTYVDCSRKIGSEPFDKRCQKCDKENGVVPMAPGNPPECQECQYGELVDSPDGIDCICPTCGCPGTCKGGVCVHEEGDMFDGAPCDDNDPSTCNDHYENCECVGETDPGECKKCVNGEVVSDDDYDPGECKKCKNGEVVADDDEDPGICWKCKDMEKEIDDSEDPGVCLKCENGNVVDDPDDPSLECHEDEWIECLPENFDNPNICQECIDYYIKDKDDGSSCDDGDPCTKNDHCVDGQCVGDPVTSQEDPDCGGK